MSDEFTYSERGFAQQEPTLTSYGATVRFYESSAACIEGEDRGPWIWMAVDQPPPTYGGQLEEAHAHAHMDLREAEEIYAKLGQIIKFTKDAWGMT